MTLVCHMFSTYEVHTCYERKSFNSKGETYVQSIQEHRTGGICVAFASGPTVYLDRHAARRSPYFHRLGNLAWPQWHPGLGPLCASGLSAQHGWAHLALAEQSTTLAWLPVCPARSCRWHHDRLALHETARCRVLAPGSRAFSLCLCRCRCVRPLPGWLYGSDTYWQ